MKRIRIFLFAAILLIGADIFPQHVIKLDVMQDISSLDPGAFLLNNNLSGQPRIFFVSIITDKPKVKIRGRVDWQESYNSSAAELLNFTTEVFSPKNFFNDQLGSMDISLKDVSGDEKRGKDLAARGKPTGIFTITLQMYDEFDNYLAMDSKDLVFLNPTAPSINLPDNQATEVQLGIAQVSWNPALGAVRYKILLCEMREGQSLEEAIQSCSNPFVNTEVDKAITSINLFDGAYKLREATENMHLALQVSTVASFSGREVVTEGDLRELVIVARNSNASLQRQFTVNPEIQRLVNLLKDKVDQTFLDSLTNGSIDPSQIQLEDENGQVLQFTDLTAILNYLEANNSSITDISFSAK
ncbi:MAG: hypothetical protein KF816_05295 [Melioribacteraceae bacterium]|jgi:hypothetical protein|nr:hypothetical protein [Melioribacteraceae bacterium]